MMLGTCLDPQEIDELMEEADVVSGCAGWWCFNYDHDSDVGDDSDDGDGANEGDGDEDQLTSGLHKLWYPGIRDTSTWRKFGAHGEHGDVFLFFNLGAL